MSRNIFPQFVFPPSIPPHGGGYLSPWVHDDWKDNIIFQSPYVVSDSRPNPGSNLLAAGLSITDASFFVQRITNGATAQFPDNTGTWFEGVFPTHFFEFRLVHIDTTFVPLDHAAALPYAIGTGNNDMPIGKWVQPWTIGAADCTINRLLLPSSPTASGVTTAECIFQIRETTTQRIIAAFNGLFTVTRT